MSIFHPPQRVLVLLFVHVSAAGEPTGQLQELLHHNHRRLSELPDDLTNHHARFPRPNPVLPTKPIRIGSNRPRISKFFTPSFHPELARPPRRGCAGLPAIQSRAV